MSAKKLCVMGLLIALTCVATMCVHIPIPATNGYINIGDSVILIAALFFGGPYGLAAGAIGSALADLLLGYTNYIPITFVVKGIEGLLAAQIAGRSKDFIKIRKVIAIVVSVIWMVTGYFISETIMYGAGAALSSVTSNCIQAIVSLILFFVIGAALHSAKYGDFENYF